MIRTESIWEKMKLAPMEKKNDSETFNMVLTCETKVYACPCKMLLRLGNIGHDTEKIIKIR